MLLLDIKRIDGKLMRLARYLRASLILRELMVSFVSFEIVFVSSVVNESAHFAKQGSRNGQW